MILIDVKDLENNTVNTIKLSDSIFSMPLNRDLLSEAVRWYRSCWRLGTQSCLTKAEVSGTTKKPFPQKGRGVARQGSLKNPHQIGGGVAFAPKPRSYRYSFPQVKKKIALLTSLSVRFSENGVKVFKEFNIKEGKTKEIQSLLKKENIKSKCLIVAEPMSALIRSVKNLKNVKYLFVSQLNTYDVLKYPFLLISEKALLEIQERFL